MYKLWAFDRETCGLFFSLKKSDGEGINHLGSNCVSELLVCHSN